MKRENPKFAKRGGKSQALGDIRAATDTADRREDRETETRRRIRAQFSRPRIWL